MNKPIFILVTPHGQKPGDASWWVNADHIVYVRPAPFGTGAWLKLSTSEEGSSFHIAESSDAVMDASAKEADPAKAKDLAQWAIQVQALAARAGPLSPFMKEPD